MRKSTIKFFLLLASLAALAACGKANGDAPSVSATGKHPADWVHTHPTAVQANVNSCTECHGEDLAGGITRVGCFSTPESAFNGFVCHASSPVAKPGCSSCHGTPPDGNVAPNRDNAHDTHFELPEVATLSCPTCHFGAGFGTPNHAKATASGGIARATVTLLDTGGLLRAKTLTSFGYDASTESCSGVICHGGQPTPSWSTGSIEVDTDCLKCHEQGTAPQTPQYNSFYSGKITLNGVVKNLHNFHVALGIFCTNCHNTTTLATNHFVGLTTPAFDAAPSTTIGGGTTSITAYTPFTATVPSGSCTAAACHGVATATRFWINN
jgi:predicted CxxxxCH...CXXCH cytochrome family protein